MEKAGDWVWRGPKLTATQSIEALCVSAVVASAVTVAMTVLGPRSHESHPSLASFWFFIYGLPVALILVVLIGGPIYWFLGSRQLTGIVPFTAAGAGAVTILAIIAIGVIRPNGPADVWLEILGLALIVGAATGAAGPLWLACRIGTRR